MNYAQQAAKIIARCRELACVTDKPGSTERLFLSPATRDAHTLVTQWMREAGLSVRTDDVGNVRGVRRAKHDGASTAVLFSHIDTVPNAGAFDGPLGVLLAITAVESLGVTELPFDLEVIAFSEEEGVRFAYPFLSSRAAVGELTAEDLVRADRDGVSLEKAIRSFGLEPAKIAETCPLAAKTFAALEVHIEQGPVLEAKDASLAVVQAIVGQTRMRLTFNGQANHAGTTPMHLRRDALVAAAEFIVQVERYAAHYEQLVATVGRMEVEPGAMNVVPGRATLTLDVRHPSDASRHAAVATLVTKAEAAGAARGVHVQVETLSEQRAVAMDAGLTAQLHKAAERAGHDAQAMFSGAGHDAMILAPHVPTTMLFVRSPGGLSHHPDETVREEDVAAALETVLNFLLHLRPH